MSDKFSPYWNNSFSPSETTEEENEKFKKIATEHFLEKYRREKQAAEEKAAEADEFAKNAQIAEGVADIGKGLMNAGRGADPVLFNRLSDLGKAPTSLERKENDFDTSVISKAGEKAKAEANKDLQKVKANLVDEKNLYDLQKGMNEDAKKADLENPDSPDSVAMRSLLQNMTQGVDFSGMSYNQMQRVAGPAMKQFEASNAFRIAKEKAKADMFKASMEAKTSLTKGQEALDRVYAKDYDSWSGGGRSAALIEMKKLDDLGRKLEKNEVTTGGMTGTFGDRFTSNKVLQARADITSSIMNSLRQILGAQFTEKEGQRVIANTWNEAESTENNERRVKRLSEDLRLRMRAKQAKADYFSEHGTLKGFSMQEPASSEFLLNDADREALLRAEMEPDSIESKKTLFRLGITKEDPDKTEQQPAKSKSMFDWE